MLRRMVRAYDACLRVCLRYNLIFQGSDADGKGEKDDSEYGRMSRGGGDDQIRSREVKNSIANSRSANAVFGKTNSGQ